ncbi:hypothetical protein [Halolactibacillus sp. JCM 19043]|uniref:hypothetical protein n=1 Tax=Halolactibacillus sp. JCM 19043 TaxID=1460638 RepID=UPI000A7F7B84|nr:hypothetical protein [Halolactibacillus sp. JCM 19043]
MDFVLIFGDSAVGKMTVGKALMEQTRLRLFHNHMMIEPVLEIFGEFHLPAIEKTRDVIFDEFLKTNQKGSFLLSCGRLVSRMTGIMFRRYMISLRVKGRLVTTWNL